MNSKKIGLFLGPLLFILIRLFLNPDGLSIDAYAVFASTLWIAFWWITEAIPIAVTSYYNNSFSIIWGVSAETSSLVIVMFFYIWVDLF